MVSFRLDILHKKTKKLSSLRKKFRFSYTCFYFIIEIENIIKFKEVVS